MNEPRRRRVLGRELNQHSAKVNYDDQVGGKRSSKRGLMANQRLISGYLLLVA